WVGRRPEDATIRAAMAETEALGGRVRYFQADVADAPALRAALAAAREAFGPFDGVEHAALELRDRTLAAMTEQDLATVLAAKTAGVVALAEAVRDDPLDFLAFFSSALSFAPAPGQGNYAAAGAFEDAYAARLRAEGLPAVVVNWGFWGSVGAVAAPGYRERFTALGIEPIEPDEGIAAFDHVLRARLPQALVVKGTPQGLALLGVTTGAEARPGTEPEAESDGRSESGAGSDAGVRSEGEAVPAELAAAMRGYATLDRLARQLLSTHHLAISSDEVAPDRRGLVAALQDVVQRAADDDPRQDPERELAEHHPELAAHATLLRRCVAAVPEVLTGRKSGVEVLLPRGSADELAAVYQGNPGSDFHHRLLAERVAARARTIAEQQGRPARILEIGAGTGGGTGFVLRACADLEPLPAVDFTDVSAAFLTRAERDLSGTYPQLAFRLLDIENDPVAQGFAAHDYDIVLAGNVLHATEDIAATLARARALLRPGGLLLVNEVTRRSDFLTLTFGLTPGWWRFRDPDRRLPHAPLCSARQWREALAEAGLTVLEIGGIPGVPDDRLQQVVAVAEEPAAAAATAAVPVVPEAPGVAEPSAAVAVSAGAARGYVKKVFAEVLKFDAADLDDTSQFDAFGIDSLVSLAIVDRFERDLGELPSTLLFEQQTIAVLAEYLLQNRAEQLSGVLAPSAPSAPSTTPVPSATVVASEPTASAAASAPTPPSRPESVSSDIAIIGVAGRYPGSPDLDAFWRNLASGTDCVTEVPADRWDWREHFDARRGRPQHTYSKWGGFLDQVDQFDAGFFGVLPRDAAAIDPQERLFLETAWTLLQDAGHLGGGHARQATGVFVGTMYGSYGRMAAASGWPQGRFTDGHSSQWSIANRVSYTLDLRGPSFAVDSACSSSLTAVHLAAESLRRGECEVAIAGGVNLLLHPAHLVALSAMGMLSAEGGCKVFDERADGFAPGEGVGAVLLKPLAAAVADGDDVWAVIKGSHLNAGGRTAGYTVPNPNAQAELVVAALRRSGVDPHGISYVEAHGTGTALGDPIEIAGLTRALHEAGAPQRCAVGSVKANIGHLEGAAGIAGLTKVLLQMRHGQIAPCANLERTNPKIELADSPLWLPTEPVDWPAGKPRLAGVSSF
ncbi:MAG: SDR family NAD(P)-dependent oxidoreductase, partial [Catenulispora sp.]|nr:SDR family NAD(P)-dependent oxidoreductase [Catenulispora sp.]